VKSAALLALVLAALALPVAAPADDGDEVRRAGTCTRSSEVTLQLEAEDGMIRVELELDEVPRGSRWAVVVLHERRLVLRKALRARGDSLELRRSVPDWFGPDTIAARATGPRAESCRASATL
jgi:hypothetical protein